MIFRFCPIYTELEPFQKRGNVTRVSMLLRQQARKSVLEQPV